MKRSRALFSFIVLGGLFLNGIGEAGASTPVGGTVHIYAPQKNSVHGTIVITGAIGDYGTTLTINKNGKAEANGNYVKITLHKGTFEINSTSFNAKSNNMQPTINKATCSVMATVTGPVTLFDGTGLYKSISGAVNITGTFGFIGPLFKNGKHKGQCNLSNSAQPISQYVLITGVGAVSF